MHGGRLTPLLPHQNQDKVYSAMLLLVKVEVVTSSLIQTLHSLITSVNCQFHSFLQDGLVNPFFILCNIN